MDKVMEYFSEIVPLTVVTLGDVGVRAIEKGSKREYSLKSVRRKVVDPTGAGDSFNAGFIYGWKLYDCVEHGLRIGSATAALCVGTVGACAETSSFDEVAEVVNDYYGLLYRNRRRTLSG